MTAEKLYILRRRIKAAFISLIFYFCRIFPVNRNRVVVCTFEGKGGFGCNPKYIVRELHKRNPNIEFVWLVNDITKKFPSYVKRVKNTQLNRAYWLSTSKVWIDNYRTPLGTKKRCGQYYLNTNHYTIAIKTVGLWRDKGFSQIAYMVSRADSSAIDALIIDSDFCKEMCPKGLLYKGRLLDIGAPRLDALYGSRKMHHDRFRNKYNLSSETKLVMYAPTFREKAEDGVRSVYSDKWTLDFVKLISVLEERFGGEWRIVLRLHPQLASMASQYIYDPSDIEIIDESQSDDMYETLAAMDVYITDYSSACFEAGYAEIPVFLYADDIDRYKGERGALFWNMFSDKIRDVGLNEEIFRQTKAELPFSIAINNEMLRDNILAFDEEEYKGKMDKFKMDLNIVFDGNASKRAADWVEEKLV